jgi:uncharacterized protein HemY
MKNKIFLFFIFIVVAIVSIFVFLNPTQVPLFITPSYKFNLPVSIIILGALIAGVILMLIISIFREIKMSLTIRKLKKELSDIAKAKNLIKNGLLNIFKGEIKQAEKQITNAIKLDDNFSYMLIQKDIADTNKIEAILNKLPYELSQFYLMEYYFNEKKYATLLNIAKELLEKENIKNIKVLKMIRDSYKAVEKIEDAIKIQDKILTFKNIDKVAEVKILAELHYLNSKNNGSSEGIENLLKKFPKFRPGYFLKYNVLKEKGEFSDAMRILFDGYKKTNDSTLLTSIIDIIEKNPDEKLIKEAEKFLSKAKDKKAEILLSILHFLNNNIVKAESIIKRYIEDKDVGNIASIIYAEVLYREDKNLKDVIELFRKVLNTQEGIHLRFYCSNCNNRLEAWYDYCPNCNGFDTICSILEKGEINGF